MTTPKQKYTAITDMMKVFEQEREFINQALRDTGEGKRCRSLETVKVRDIKDYCHELLLEAVEGVD